MTELTVCSPLYYVLQTFSSVFDPSLKKNNNNKPNCRPRLLARLLAVKIKRCTRGRCGVWPGPQNCGLVWAGPASGPHGPNFLAVHVLAPQADFYCQDIFFLKIWQIRLAKMSTKPLLFTTKMFHVKSYSIINCSKRRHQNYIVFSVENCYLLCTLKNHFAMYSSLKLPLAVRGVLPMY